MRWHVEVNFSRLSLNWIFCGFRFVKGDTPSHHPLPWDFPLKTIHLNHLRVSPMNEIHIWTHWSWPLTSKPWRSERILFFDSTACSNNAIWIQLGHSGVPCQYLQGEALKWWLGSILTRARFRCLCFILDDVYHIVQNIYVSTHPFPPKY